MLSREEILRHMQQASYRPLSYQELLDTLHVGEDQQGQFAKMIGRLQKDGEILKTRRDKYGLPEKMNTYRGVIKLSQRGHGIFTPEDADTGEVFIYGRNLNGAMHEDRVLVRLSERNGQRPEGEVIRAITRAHKELVGTFEKRRHATYVIPDDSRQIYPVYVKVDDRTKVRHGDKVLVRLTTWPDKNQYPEGQIVEVFGKKGQPGVDIQIVIKKHGLREGFSAAVLEEARRVDRPVAAAEVSGRRDLRRVRMVTIDGEDAKDLDDAVSIERVKVGYRLGVHIADVSHYVKEDSKLDKEACERGTSVYLVDKVLPMLPPELSNGICSLNAGQDRLAMSCLMDLDPSGKVRKYEIVPSVIHVQQRMTYTAVNRILDEDDAETLRSYPELIEDFRLMKELADILRAERMKRGALDFDFPEPKVIVDEKGFPLEIRVRSSGSGELLIEDFMIKANEVVAEHLLKNEAPALYRVHEKPEGDSLTRLNNVLGVFGHKLPENRINPQAFQKILAGIKGTPGEKTISLMLLRSMKHARYAPQALGHFGLASRFYCHFTSPIRRYPDLIVHRSLKLLLAGEMKGSRRAQLEKRMGYFGEHATIQEIKAEEAERDLVAIKKCQYMKQFIGEEFEATISSVLAFGFFVELPNTVEGLVHISSIQDDYYHFNDRTYTLTGSHGGKTYSIGDKVRVLLVKVDVDDVKIDFELVR
ncbi:MAG: ribonuclease R [Syntrophomonas sp.]|nr:ribonuclease R [Syntrophomonas sp.]